MPDNTETASGTGVKVATDKVTYSGDADQNVQLVRMVGVAGTEGSKTVTDIPLSARSGLGVDVTNLPPGLLDTFGKLQVVNCINDVDVQFWRDVPANLTTVATANGGTATQSTGMMQLASSTATNGTVSATSLDTVLYRSGGEVFALVTAAFLDTAEASSYQRIGLYDANNGFFFGYEGVTFGVTVRTGAADTQTAKASWNGDQLTAATGSRFTRGGTPEAVDFTKLNVFRIRFGWLGAAPIKFEILSPDGEWVVIHTIRQPNLSASPSIQSVDIPIRAEVGNTGSATSKRLNTACWGAGTTYDKVDIVGSNTLGTAANSVVNYNVQGVGTLHIHVGTSTTGTIIVESTGNGSTWITHPSCWLLGAAGSGNAPIIAALTPTSGNIFIVQCAGFRSVRVRTATTLGATVILHAHGDNKAVQMAVRAEGGAAHDSVDAGSPVKVGMKAIAHGATPTAVAAADRTDWYANRAGVPFVIGGHPNIQSSEYFTSGAITDDTILPAIAGGTIYVITSITVTCSAANVTSPSVRIGFGTANVPTLGATNADAVAKVVLSHPGIPPGGGLSKGNGAGIVGIGGDGEELRITCTTPTTSLIVQVDWYTIAS